jgi:hypothetical protein
MVDRSVRLVISRGNFGSVNEFNVSYESGREVIAAESNIDRKAIRKHIEIYLSGHLPSGVARSNLREE